MHKVIEESQELQFKENRGDAANRNAVELKQNIKIPEEIFYLFSEEGPDGKMREITVKNLQTLEKYGQGAAARNYTKQLKIEFVKDIASKDKETFFGGFYSFC